MQRPSETHTGDGLTQPPSGFVFVEAVGNAYGRWVDATATYPGRIGIAWMAINQYACTM